jgi:cytochrome P450
MVPFTGAGDRMRRQRRILVKAIGPGSIKTYEPIFDGQSRELVQNLAKPTMDFRDTILWYNAGLTLMLLYGYKATSADDRFMKLAADSTEVLSNKLVTGGGVWAVDIFPFLRHLPSWFPGAGFKQSAVEWKKLIEAFVNEPFEDCKEKIRNGTATPSFTSLAFDSKENMTAQEDFDLRWTTNSMYTASIDTTGSAIANFVLAMVRHPDVFAKARAEVDSVVGRSRLPNFGDRPAMPYIEAMLSECLRYSAPAPLNLPHRLMEDDEYNGYFLPKGSWVVGNIWAISRDETAYPDPNSFKPERFLEPVDAETKKRMDPRNYVFGAGRRKCPGIHLVDAGLWLVIARIVSTLDIRKKVVDGVEVEPEVSYDNAFLRVPSAFEFDIKPRPHVNWDLL